MSAANTPKSSEGLSQKNNNQNTTIITYVPGLPTQYWAVYMTVFGTDKKSGQCVACQRVYTVDGHLKTEILSKPVRMGLLSKALVYANQQHPNVLWKGHARVGPIISLGTLVEPSEACQIGVDYEVSSPGGPLFDTCVINVNCKLVLTSDIFMDEFKRLSQLDHPGQLCLITSIVIV